MTSERKITTNRANGRMSRGPKTIQGKRRSSKNALRYGLSLPVAADPRLRQDVEALAREIVGGADNVHILGMARQVAEAQIDLIRIRSARHKLLMRDSDPPVGGKANSVPSADLILQLVKIERYERRTLSRRKTAIRELIGSGQLPVQTA